MTECHSSLCTVGMAAMLLSGLLRHSCEGVLDTVAPRSFISLPGTEQLGPWLGPRIGHLHRLFCFIAAKRQQLHIGPLVLGAQYIVRKQMRVGTFSNATCTIGDFPTAKATDLAEFCPVPPEW